MITLTSVAGTLGMRPISIPAAQADGLPVGLSILGAQGADGLLLQLARRYGGGG